MGTTAPVSKDEDAAAVAASLNGQAAPSSSIARRVAVEAGPSLLVASVMLGLIFGGCCSNVRSTRTPSLAAGYEGKILTLALARQVYALEAIINFEPASGTLLTFVQFVFVAVTGYIAQFDRTRPPFFVAPAKVPMRRWLINIVLFFSINVLNNHAFSYDISVPVHIILRSGGSITTMLAGYLYGKRYSRIQAMAVALLSCGITLAAWSDAKEKVGLIPGPTRNSPSTVVLFLTPHLHVGWPSSGFCAANPQHGPRDTVRGPGAVGHHGALHRGDVQALWSAVEGEPLLLAHTVAAPLPALCAVHGPHVERHAQERTPTGAGAARDGVGGRTRAQPAGVSCHERLDPVCLHPGRQPARGHVLGADGHHCAQHPQARQPAAEHLAFRELADWGHAVGCRGGFRLRGALLGGLEAEGGDEEAEEPWGRGSTGGGQEEELTSVYLSRMYAK
ncbi:AMP deaminase [Tolypocladium paradoxum]|uniref:AMP deaminase n=1 Tax=Tolypocladium paradoxum TaxID=94208 RepID=A0A2S4L7W2_9HYPO|nr:AMP deaminase [Tolypocladium paradoxum]